MENQLLEVLKSIQAKLEAKPEAPKNEGQKVLETLNKALDAINLGIATNTKIAKAEGDVEKPKTDEEEKKEMKDSNEEDKEKSEKAKKADAGQDYSANTSYRPSIKEFEAWAAQLGFRKSTPEERAVELSKGNQVTVEVNRFLGDLLEIFKSNFSDLQGQISKQNASISRLEKSIKEGAELRSQSETALIKAMSKIIDDLGVIRTFPGESRLLGKAFGDQGGTGPVQSAGKLTEEQRKILKSAGMAGKITSADMHRADRTGIMPQGLV